MSVCLHGALALPPAGESAGCLFLAEKGLGSHRVSKADPQVKRMTWKETGIKHPLSVTRSWKVAFKVLAPRWEKDLRGDRGQLAVVPGHPGEQPRQPAPLPSIRVLKNASILATGSPSDLGRLE